MANVELALLALFSLHTISELEVVGNSWLSVKYREDCHVFNHHMFPRKSTGWDTIFFKFCPTWAMHCTNDAILPHFVVLFSAYELLLSLYLHPPSPCSPRNRHSSIQPVPTHPMRKKCFIFLLLLLSDDIELNACPDIKLSEYSN